MDYTANYQLPVWAETDRILMDDFNDLTETIDEALTELSAFRVETGTYVGTGGITGGPLTFSKPPIAAMVRPSTGGDILLLFHGGSGGIYIRAMAPTTSQMGRVNITWSGNTATWYKNYTETNDDSSMNKSGVTYHYLALISAA